MLGIPLHAAHPADSALLDAARARQSAVIESLKDRVQIETGSDGASGVQKMAKHYDGCLRHLGRAHRMVPVSMPAQRPDAHITIVPHPCGTRSKCVAVDWENVAAA